MKTRLALALALTALTPACDPLPDDQTNDLTTTTASTSAATTTDEDAGTTDPSETEDSTGDDEVIAPPPTPNAGCPGEPCQLDADCAGNPDAPSIIPRCFEGACAWQCVPPNLEGVCGPGSECMIDEVGTGNGLCSGVPVC